MASVIDSNSLTRFVTAASNPPQRGMTAAEVLGQTQTLRSNAQKIQSNQLGLETKRQNLERSRALLPTEIAQGKASLEATQLQSEAREFELEQAEEEVRIQRARQQEMESILQDPNPERRMRRLQQSFPDEYLATQEKILANRQSQLEIREAQLGIARELLAGVSDQQSYDAAKQELVRLLGPEADVDRLPGKYSESAVRRVRGMIGISHDIILQKMTDDAIAQREQLRESEATRRAQIRAENEETVTRIQEDAKTEREQIKAKTKTDKPRKPIDTTPTGPEMNAVRAAVKGSSYWQALKDDTVEIPEEVETQVMQRVGQRAKIINHELPELSLMQSAERAWKELQGAFYVDDGALKYAPELRSTGTIQRGTEGPAKLRPSSKEGVDFEYTPQL